ncbi:MAG: glycosyltransferase [Candidatus Gracilibacteria bacterium]
MVFELQKNEDLDLDLFYQARKRCESIHKIFPTARHIPISNTIFHFKSLLFFPRLPKSYFLVKPDVIWIPDRRPFYRSDIPLFMTIHDLVPEKYSKTLSLKSFIWHKIFPLKRLLKLCDGLLAPSLSTLSALKKFSLPCDVTYEGATLPSFKKMPVFAKDFLDKRFFLAISPLDPRKRLSWIYETAYRFSQVNFLIAGVKDGDKRFKSFVGKKLANVFLLPQITEEEKFWLLKNTIALLALSEYEGFDLPVLEAVKAKCPVLLSSIDVHHELYKEADFVITKEELQAKIYSALESKSKSTIRVPKPRGDYTWEKSAKRALLFFARVLVNKNR